MNPLSERLVELRKKAGLTVRGLAEKISKTPGYVSRLEGRGEIPSPELLCELAGLYGVQPEDLLALAKKSQLEKAAEEIDAKQRSALTLFRRKKQ
jgi:transcriptional regulator with XRE-family HTH domain